MIYRVHANLVDDGKEGAVFFSTVSLFRVPQTNVMFVGGDHV